MCVSTFRTTVSHPGADLETLAAHPQWNTRGINGQPWYKMVHDRKSLKGPNEGRTARTDVFLYSILAELRSAHTKLKVGKKVTYVISKNLSTSIPPGDKARLPAPSQRIMGCFTRSLTPKALASRFLQGLTDTIDAVLLFSQLSLLLLGPILQVFLHICTSLKNHSFRTIR